MEFVNPVELRGVSVYGVVGNTRSVETVEESTGAFGLVVPEIGGVSKTGVCLPLNTKPPWGVAVGGW